MTTKKKKRLWMRTIILAILMSAVVYTIYANANRDKEVVEVGKLAPDFALEDMDGNIHQLSDYRGKGVLINFWGTWCEPCKKEMPYLNNQYNDYKDQGVTILAVNLGEPKFLINNFLKRYPLDFPILLDTTKDVSTTAYDIYHLPATVLVDPEGIVVEIVEGELPEARIRGMMEMIKPK